MSLQASLEVAFAGGCFDRWSVYLVTEREEKSWQGGWGQTEAFEAAQNLLSLRDTLCFSFLLLDDGPKWAFLKDQHS